MTGPLRIAALVVTHDRLPQLQTTLTRLLAEPLDHVMVVDNESTDATAAWLAAQTDPRLRVLRLAENRGGAGGFEAGLDALRTSVDPDWSVMMDDDARPLPGTIAAFRAAAARTDPDGGDIGAFVAAVTYPDGRLCEMNRPSRNPFWHGGLILRTLRRGSRAGFHMPDSAFSPETGPSEVDVASFVGFFVNRGAVTRAGLPEGGLFIYGDDVLYSLRLRRAGLRIILDPSLRFEHDCGTLGEGFVYRPLWKIYYHCRNGVSIARQAAGSVVFPAALAWYVANWWRRGWRYAPAERAIYRRMMWMGLRDGLLHRRGRNDAVHRMAQGVVPAGLAPLAQDLRRPPAAQEGADGRSGRQDGPERLET